MSAPGESRPSVGSDDFAFGPKAEVAINRRRPRREWLALLWQIFRCTGFPNQFFCDSWVVGFGGPTMAGKEFEVGRRAWTLAQAVLGSLGSQGAAADVSALRGGVDRAV